MYQGILRIVMVVLTFLLGCLDKSGSGWRVIRDSYHYCSNRGCGLVIGYRVFSVRQSVFFRASLFVWSGRDVLGVSVITQGSTTQLTSAAFSVPS